MSISISLKKKKKPVHEFLSSSNGKEAEAFEKETWMNEEWIEGKQEGELFIHIQVTHSSGWFI